MTIHPSIILVRPQMGENIGAAARAMANFGLQELRLVAPRDGWPNPKAGDMAGKALPIIDDAALYADTKAAVADCQFVLATTSRARAMQLPVLEVREAMQQMQARVAHGERCAILFGPERTGLENDDVMLADAVVTIPVAPEYPSLNVAQAVVIACYEWLMAEALSPRGRGLGEGAHPRFSPVDGTLIPLRQEASGDAVPSFSPEGRRSAEASPRDNLPMGGGTATRSELDGLFGQLETSLDDVNFWRVPEKKEIMWRNIRTTLVRAGMSAQEVATWRGIIRALRGG